MIGGEFRPALSGKQSDENLDTSLLSNVPSEPPHPGSRPLFLANSDVRYGSQAEESSCRGWAEVSTSGLLSVDRNP